MASTEEQVRKYEAWLSVLEGKARAYRAREALYHRILLGMIAASLGGFFVSAYVGLWTLGCASLIAFGGYYMIKTRHWEFAQEIAEVRADLAKLRG